MPEPFDLEKALEDCASHEDILNTIGKAEAGLSDPLSWISNDLLPILRSLQVRLMDLEERLETVEEDTDEALDRLDGSPLAAAPGMVQIPYALAEGLSILCSSVGLDLPLGRSGDKVIPQANVANVARTLYLSLRSALEQRHVAEIIEEVDAAYPTLAIKQEFPQGEA